MKRPKHILARDDGGTQVIILEIEADGHTADQASQYELANRSKVERISDREFVVAESGVVLTRTNTPRP